MARPLSGKYKHEGPLYQSWKNMKLRCDDPNHPFAYRYHSRGISYHPRWKSFDNFYEDMSPSYKQGLTLERENNDKGYSLENCRWATPKEQANNTRRNRHLTIRGKTKTLAQWCDESAVKPSTVRQRFYVYGWPLEKALIS